MPGTYTVRLTADGRTQTQALVVKMDPRVTASAADIKRQYDTSRAIDAALRRASTALSEIRKMTTKSAPIADFEQRLSRVVGTLSQLFNAVEQSDAAPTAVVMEAWKTTSAEVESALADWQKVRMGH